MSHQYQAVDIDDDGTLHEITIDIPEPGLPPMFIVVGKKVYRRSVETGMYLRAKTAHLEDVLEASAVVVGSPLNPMVDEYQCSPEVKRLVTRLRAAMEKAQEALCDLHVQEHGRVEPIRDTIETIRLDLWKELERTADLVR